MSWKHKNHDLETVDKFFFIQIYILYVSIYRDVKDIASFCLLCKKNHWKNNTDSPEEPFDSLR